MPKKTRQKNYVRKKRTTKKKRGGMMKNAAKRMLGQEYYDRFKRTAKKLNIMSKHSKNIQEYDQFKQNLDNLQSIYDTPGKVDITSSGIRFKNSIYERWEDILKILNFIVKNDEKNTIDKNIIEIDDPKMEKLLLLKNSIEKIVSSGETAEDGRVIVNTFVKELWQCHGLYNRDISILRVSGLITINSIANKKSDQKESPRKRQKQFSSEKDPLIKSGFVLVKPGDVIVAFYKKSEKKLFLTKPLDMKDNVEKQQAIQSAFEEKIRNPQPHDIFVILKDVGNELKVEVKNAVKSMNALLKKGKKNENEEVFKQLEDTASRLNLIEKAKSLKPSSLPPPPPPPPPANDTAANDTPANDTAANDTPANDTAAAVRKAANEANSVTQADIVIGGKRKTKRKHSSKKRKH